MSGLVSGLGARLVVVGAVGGAASAAGSLLVSMRLGCRGVQAVNLGTGVTLGRAADELSRRQEAEALLFISDDNGRGVVRQLAGLGELQAVGAVARPVFVGGTGSGSWRELRSVAARLHELGVAQVLSDVVDAVYLLPSRRAYATGRVACSPSRAGRRVPVG
ncbi:hypothetical protein V1L54_21660 [Streptomyces sp. TRM 70361]|uniref:hypothetical protein n=1 Tax=Streptomyces sp. TRM 70361 TaxID=3116553 RepID=UPI002E7B551A|nr:hypothetical protein [Streptomyces sp. TRM 70361]MEE1941976.1 hypothetical protein [Streptomyces sp. TRM 70361]